MGPFQESQANGWQRAYTVTCACGSRRYWSRRVEGSGFSLEDAEQLAFLEGWVKHGSEWYCRRCAKEQHPGFEEGHPNVRGCKG